MDKFNRNFQLFLDTNDGGQVTIEKPFSVQFNIVRNTLSSANASNIRIYNLSETTRQRIGKDRYDYASRRNIAFFAGYGSDLPLVFSGNITHCYSVREGVDIVTTIDAFDGGFAYANALLENAQYVKGTGKKALLEDMISRLSKFGIEKGVIGNLEGELSRGNSFSGPITKTIQEVSGGIFFIDSGKAYLLKENEVVSGAIREINSDTGLLGTPKWDNQSIELNIIFEPRLSVGQSLSVESTTYKQINGLYKVTAITHTGMISDSVAGTATTKVGCFTGKALVEV